MVSWDEGAMDAYAQFVRPLMPTHGDPEAQKRGVDEEGASSQIFFFYFLMKKKMRSLRMLRACKTL